MTGIKLCWAEAPMPRHAGKEENSNTHENHILEKEKEPKQKLNIREIFI